MEAFRLFSLPKPIIHIICDYHMSFVYKLVADACDHEDAEAISFYRTHLPTRRLGGDFWDLLDHCPTCESNRPFPNPLWYPLCEPPNPKYLSDVVDKGCIHVMWLCVENRWFAPNTFTRMICRLQLDAENLQKLYARQYLDPYMLRYAMNVKPWPELITWFKSIGWRFSKKRTPQ